jgi:hypothetical protein
MARDEETLSDNTGRLRLGDGQGEKSPGQKVRLDGGNFKSIDEIKNNLFTKPDKRTKSLLHRGSPKSEPSEIQGFPKRSDSFDSAKQTAPTAPLRSVDLFCDSPTPSTSTMYTSDSNSQSETSTFCDMSSEISLLTLERDIFSSIISTASLNSSLRSKGALHTAIDREEWLAERNNLRDMPIGKDHIIEWELQSPEMTSGWYEGQLVNNEIPHGKGTFSFANGDKYEGSFDMGAIHGPNAVYTEADGSVYRGEFQNNLRHGQGNYLTPRRRYIGSFEYGKPHGQGTQFYLDGSVDFEGDWVFGEPYLDVDIDDSMMRSLLEEISGSVSVDNISIVLAGERKQLEEEKFEIEGIAMTVAKEKKSVEAAQTILWEAEVNKMFEADVRQSQPLISLCSERLEL